MDDTNNCFPWNHPEASGLRCALAALRRVAITSAADFHGNNMRFTQSQMTNANNRKFAKLNFYK
jgi:hypothetical protein